MEVSVFDKLSWIAHLDQAILSKAFRGELVSQDPNDAIESPPTSSTTKSVPAPTQTKRPGKDAQRNVK
jgi:hypothetical protein